MLTFNEHLANLQTENNYCLKRSWAFLQKNKELVTDLEHCGVIAVVNCCYIDFDLARTIIKLA